MAQTEKQYEPFGEEWKKEMMKLNKTQLIEWLKKAFMEKQELIKRLNNKS